MPLSWSFVQMHIVSKRKDLTLDEALQAPDGLAMLGVFIEVKPGVVKLLTVVYMLYWLSNTWLMIHIPCISKKAKSALHSNF